MNQRELSLPQISEEVSAMSKYTSVEFTDSNGDKATVVFDDPGSVRHYFKPQIDDFLSMQNIEMDSAKTAVKKFSTYASRTMGLSPQIIDSKDANYSVNLPTQEVRFGDEEEKENWTKRIGINGNWKEIKGQIVPNRIENGNGRVGAALSSPGNSNLWTEKSSIPSY